MRLALLALFVASCRTPAEPPASPSNAAPASRAVIADDAKLGWLGIGLADPNDGRSWIPSSATFSAMVPTGDPLPSTPTVIGVSGAARVLTLAPPGSVEHGCDGYEIGGLLTGPRLPRGPAWVLPPTMPPSWSPTALELRSTRSEVARHDYVAGPLTLQLTRTDDAHGRLQIFRDGRLIHERPFERAETSMRNPPAIDLVQGDASVPLPYVPKSIAIWSLAPAGPFLVALLWPAFASVSIEALLVDDREARPIPSMGLHLEVCSF